METAIGLNELARLDQSGDWIGLTSAQWKLLTDVLNANPDFVRDVVGELRFYGEGTVVLSVRDYPALLKLGVTSTLMLKVVHRAKFSMNSPRPDLFLPTTSAAVEVLRLTFAPGEGPKPFLRNHSTPPVNMARRETVLR